jgi:hypothetical protein
VIFIPLPWQLECLGLVLVYFGITNCACCIIELLYSFLFFVVLSVVGWASLIKQNILAVRLPSSALKLQRESFHLCLSATPLSMDLRMLRSLGGPYVTKLQILISIEGSGRQLAGRFVGSRYGQSTKQCVQPHTQSPSVLALEVPVVGCSWRDWW